MINLNLSEDGAFNETYGSKNKRDATFVPVALVAMCWHSGHDASRARRQWWSFKRESREMRSTPDQK